MAQRQSYREGDWFAAPLGDGRYVLGRISRHAQGIVFAYFFAPPLDHLPTLEELGERRADDAFTQLRFSDLGLHDGDWPVLGQTGRWDREAWPLLEFENRLDVRGGPDVLYAVRLAENTVSREVSVKRVDLSEAGKRPTQDLFGAEAAIIHLREMLDELS